MKKLVSSILALTLCLTVVGQMAISAEDETIEVDGLVYTENIDCYSLTDCTDKSVTSITIPGEVNRLPVTSVDYQFRDCTNLQEILVDETMQASGYYTSVDGVLFTGQEIVSACPPAKTGAFEIPAGTVAIDENAFASCNALTSITIPDSVEYVGSNAFVDCTSLEKIEGTILVDSNLSFKGCKSLKELSVFNNGQLTAFTLDSLDSLEKVDIGGSGLFSLALQVQNCGNLKSFRVSEAKDGVFTSSSNAELSLNLRMIVNDCPALQELYVPSYIETASIKNCADLEKIIFSKNASGVARISNCPSVTTILNYSDITTIFFNDDNSVNTEITKNADLIVYGYENNRVKNVCTEYDVTFRAFGDVDGDENVTLLDVVTLNKYLMIGTQIDDAARIAADVNNSGTITPVDSLNILKYLVNIIDSFDVQ